MESIYIYRHCEFNEDVIKLLFDHNISLLLFSFSGKYIGSYRPAYNQLGSLLVKQGQCITNNDSKMKFTKEIIKTSIKNMISVLKYYNKKGIDLINEINELEENILLIDNKENPLIYEARSKQRYYQCFNKILKNKDFVFTIHSTYPPKDCINAIMSYGYALLYSIIETDIYASNLCISLPFVHGISKQKTGLQYDIADIFKPVLVDRLIFRLVNKKQLTKEFFQINDEITLLNKEGTKLFIEEFEKSLQQIIPVTNKRKMTYRSIIRREVQKIEKAISENSDYKGYLMRW